MRKIFLISIIIYVCLFSGLSFAEQGCMPIGQNESLAIPNMAELFECFNNYVKTRIDFSWINTIGFPRPRSVIKAVGELERLKAKTLSCS